MMSVRIKFEFNGRILLLLQFTNYIFWLQSDENTNSFRFLVRANNQSEWIWQIYLKYAMGGFIVTSIFMVVFSVEYSIIVYDHFDVHEVFHVYKLW